MNELTGSLTLTSGIQARAADMSIADSLEGTVVWEYDPMECPQTIIKLYKGMMKAYVNQTSTYEGSTVVVEHQDKDQAARLEVAESFILCSHQAFQPISRTSPSLCTRTTGWRWPRVASRARRAKQTSPG